MNDITLGVFDEEEGGGGGREASIKKLNQMSRLIDEYVERYRAKIDGAFLKSTEKWDPLTALLIKCYLLKQGIFCDLSKSKSST